MRRCPCGHTLSSFGGLSSHIKAKHCDRTPNDIEAQTYCEHMAMLGGDISDDEAFGCGGYGGWGSGYGGDFGFCEGDVEELLCQGVKPWDSDAEDVLAVLNGDYDF